VQYQSKSFVKIYPDFLKVYVYPVSQLRNRLNDIVPEGKEPVTTKSLDMSDSEIEALPEYMAEAKELLKQRSVDRSKMTVSDLLLCNDFDMFVTITFSPDKHDRYDISHCKKVMSKWLANQREAHGRFRYVIVPEHHKDGALHFHAVFGGYPKSLLKRAVSAKTGKKMGNIYNLKSFRGGFTKVEMIKSKQRVSSYIRKYITKDMVTFDGSKRYWASKDLQRPKYSYRDDIINNPFVKPIDVWQPEHGFFEIRTFNLKQYDIIQAQRMGLFPGEDYLTQLKLL